MVQDQQELQQAAAAIARLTPPSMPVMQDQAQAMSQEKEQTPNTVPSAAQQLKELEQRVQEAGMEAMTFGSDSEDDVGMPRRADKYR